MTTNAEVAKFLTEDIVGLISRVVEKRLNQILDEIESGVSGKRDPSRAVPDSKHPSHETRGSDSSLYDEVCVKCGATDNVPGGWGKLAEPCTAVHPAPAVPDVMPMEPFQTVDKGSNNYKAGWNACRQAMLAALGEQ